MDLDAFSFLDLVQKRRSVRAYRSHAVTPEVLNRCLEAARLAPSACNGQPWTFVVVDDAELKNEIAALTADRLLPINHFTQQAPIIVAIVVEKVDLSVRFGGLAKKRPLPWIDCGIVAEHFCLQAAVEGLGTCILGWFKERPIKALLKIPTNKRIGLLITLGVPKDNRAREKKRKDLIAIVRHNSYKEV